ncbi:MAG: InlB B-repeat-containing protein, partial [Eubacterium sp.]|nr:InlB B-repeat-containing protein [Eubacterium sp.]
CYSPTRFDDCDIRLNNSKGDGGGIYADFSGAKYNVTLTKTAVQENICQGSGGGVYLKDEKKNGKIVLGGGKTIINYNKNKKSDNDNISFKVFREIKVIGGFKTGSIIGVSCNDSCNNRLLTKGYSEYNKDAADLYFTFDNLDYKISGDEKLPEAKVIKKLVPSAKGYKIKFEIKVTNDADDWDEAYVEVYCRKANGVGSELKKYTTDDITDSIDHKDGEYTSGEIDCGDDFPTKINVYANFGGGLVIRGWEADVKIWINGENSGSTHIKRKLTGNTKKKGVADNWINIGGDKYPYLYDYEINQKREIDLTNDKTKEVSIRGVDQYGVEWKSAGMDYIKMENKSFPGEDTFKCLDGKGFKWRFDTSKTKVCHNSIYCLKFKSGSNIQEWTELIIGVRFRVPLYITVRIGNDKTAYKQVQKITGRQSEVIEVKIPDAGKGYIVDKVKNEGTCYITPPEEDGDVYKVTLGAQDVIMTFVTSPIKYKIEFDKNATEGNKVSGSIVKMSVSYDEAKKLSKNVFKSKNGYKFAGWNTKADGTGKSYKDGEEIINLSSINKDVVTLYAQWEDEDGNLVTASLFSDGTYGTQIIFLFLVSVAIVMGSKLAVKKRG